MVKASAAAARITRSNATYVEMAKAIQVNGFRPQSYRIKSSKVATAMPVIVRRY